MNIREKTEEIERLTLHHKATLSSRSRGRPSPEPEDAIRTCFQRDRDRIIHSKAFRRLKHKTQVFLAPRGDHYRTRLTHVLEVAQIARTIARALRLNEDLVEAIALGHDLGHTPFGHAGEAVLREIHPAGFDHYEQSLRIVDCLEKSGRGLNLTYEVRDGIVRHSKGKGRIFCGDGGDTPCTPEGMVVRVSDIIAYVNHDLDDALRADVVTQQDIPPAIVRTLGDSHARRINTLVNDVVSSTLAGGMEEIAMSPPVSEAVYSLRDFLYERVYESGRILKEFNKARAIIKALYEYYLCHPEEVMPGISEGDVEGRHRAVCDFVAGMTDGFALMTYERLFLPRQWTVI